MTVSWRSRWPAFSSSATPPRGNTLASPPVHHLHLAEGTHHHVGGLQVAVDHTPGMRVGDGLGDRLEDGEDAGAIVGGLFPIFQHLGKCRLSLGTLSCRHPGVHQETGSAPRLAPLPIARAAESRVSRSIHHHRQNRRTHWPARTCRAYLSSEIDFVQQHALNASLMPLPLKNSEDKHSSRARSEPPQRPAARIEIRSYPFAVKRTTTARGRAGCNDAHVIDRSEKNRQAAEFSPGTTGPSKIR
jgi:hypothetical protein